MARTEKELQNDASAQRHIAELWRETCPEGWGFIVETALKEAAHGRRFGVAYLAEQLRRKDFTDSSGGTFKVNNNMRAAIARLLVEEHPHLGQFIETRKSACDWSFDA